MAENDTQRHVYEIAREIEADWSAQGKGINYAAKPYLSAMFAIGLVSDRYGADSAASVIRYFLANATTWRGETARRIKAELKSMVKGKY